MFLLANSYYLSGQVVVLFLPTLYNIPQYFLIVQLHFRKLGYLFSLSLQCASAFYISFAIALYN